MERRVRVSFLCQLTMMLVVVVWCLCLARLAILHVLCTDRAGGGAGRHPLVSWCGETNGMDWGFVGTSRGYVFGSIAACSMICRTGTSDRLRRRAVRDRVLSVS
jgi:hypothetical protein